MHQFRIYSKKAETFNFMKLKVLSLVLTWKQEADLFFIQEFLISKRSKFKKYQCASSYKKIRKKNKKFTFIKWYYIFLKKNIARNSWNRISKRSPVNFWTHKTLEKISVYFSQWIAFRASFKRQLKKIILGKGCAIYCIWYTQVVIISFERFKNKI